MNLSHFLVSNLAKIYKLLHRSYHTSMYNHFRKKYKIDSSFRFNGPGTKVYGDGEVFLGKNSYVGRYSTIQSSPGSKVIVGKNCKIGPFFMVWTQSAEADFDFNDFSNIPPKTGDIIIKDAVWIGANVYIAPGVTIGENSVIGTNSVVTKNVEPNSVYGGIPAKLLRKKSIKIG